MEWQLALKDADTCVEMEPTFVKGWTRKAGDSREIGAHAKRLEPTPRNPCQLEPLLAASMRRMLDACSHLTA